MSSLLTYHNDVFLDLAEYDIEQLRTVVEAGGVLFWNMNGLMGKLPNAALQDALRVLDVTRTLDQRGRRLMGVEPKWLIHWHQTVTPQDHRAALTHPLLRPSQT